MFFKHAKYLTFICLISSICFASEPSEFVTGAGAGVSQRTENDVLKMVVGPEHCAVSFDSERTLTITATPTDGETSLYPFPSSMKVQTIGAQTESSAIYSSSSELSKNYCEILTDKPIFVDGNQTLMVAESMMNPNGKKPVYILTTSITCKSADGATIAVKAERKCDLNF